MTAPTRLFDRYALLFDEAPHLLHEFFEQQVLRRRPSGPGMQRRDAYLSGAGREGQPHRPHAARARDLPGRVGRALLRQVLSVFAALLGILKAGAGYVPIDPKTPAERLQSIVSDAALPIILTESRLGRELPCLQSTDAVLLDRLSEELERFPDRPLSARQSGVTLLDPCYVIFTSG